MAELILWFQVEYSDGWALIRKVFLSLIDSLELKFVYSESFWAVETVVIFIRQKYVNQHLVLHSDTVMCSTRDISTHFYTLYIKMQQWTWDAGSNLNQADLMNNKDNLHSGAHQPNKYER